MKPGVIQVKLAIMDISTLNCYLKFKTIYFILPHLCTPTNHFCIRTFSNQYQNKFYSFCDFITNVYFSDGFNIRYTRLIQMKYHVCNFDIVLMLKNKCWEYTFSCFIFTNTCILHFQLLEHIS